MGCWELEKALEAGYHTYREGMKNLDFLSMKKTGLTSNSIMTLKYVKIYFIGLQLNPRCVHGLIRYFTHNSQHLPLRGF